MHLDFERIRQLLKAFDFRTMFVDELGWDRHDAHLDMAIDGRMIRLEALAQKRGMVSYLCPTAPGEPLPDYATRRKIESQAAKTAHEHLIIFVDPDQTTQVWQWVRREPGKPTACREHTLHKTQPGDALIQKLQAIAFSLEEEETLTLSDVTRRARAGFDVERVTKRFYDRFKKEHGAFLKFVTGITEKTDLEWYASVMLNRLMFVYFIQRKGFLDGEIDYLRSRLRQMQKEYGQDRFYSFYRYFLLRLFHEGLGGKSRTPELEKLLGKIPYFDGGFFERHPVEQRYPDIQIPDEAFERIFDYFDQYQWHLDERPLRADNEINPDVLGYIFEKYINQKQMGAYYTKEDITEYISKNTVIPFLFDAARSRCKVAFENPGGLTVWGLLTTNPDRYLYKAVKHGVIREEGSILPESDLPDFVQTGMHDPKARMFDKRYNLQQAPAHDPVRLVTETWREYVYRRNRCLEIRKKLQQGEVKDINDLITFNLDIRQFAQDVIENCEGPDLLRAFWQTINGHVPDKSHEKYQNGITILDPTCGSGAFLFAALNILEPLYEACLDRMAAFVEDLDRSTEKHRPEKFSDFRKILKQMEGHPNRRYYIFKNIILYNLFGVDIMEEAVEICKLRLFLKLVAQIEPDPGADNFGIEPLPDIDFNIRAGNTLVGYATADDVRTVFKEKPVGKQAQTRLQFGDVLSEYERFEERVELADRAFKHFRRMQTDPDMNPKDFADAKQTLRDRLKLLNDELNRNLAGEYGINAKKAEYANWLKSHQPFHWFVEFYGIMKDGGYDVIIGNPPYVQISKIQGCYGISGYITTGCRNLYALIGERCGILGLNGSRLGLIVPIGSASLSETETWRGFLSETFDSVHTAHYAIRPAKLFNGVEQRLTIYLAQKGNRKKIPMISSKYHQWYVQERSNLFALLQYGHAPKPHSSNIIIKGGSELGTTILEKVNKHSQEPFGKTFKYGVGHRLFFHRTPGYWVRILDFLPYFRSPAGDRSIHHIRELTCVDGTAAGVLGATISSSTYFFWLFASGNCRNLTLEDVRLFPAGCFSSPNSQALVRLFSALMEDFQRNSFLNHRGDSEFQEFDWELSKPIINQIDQVLAKHYGFTDEELDFIINYDIKYRMGRGADGGGEE